MAAKKNKTKKLPRKTGVDIWTSFNIPPVIIQLLGPTNYRGSLLHFMRYGSGTMKSWIRMPTRCSRSGERGCPELHLLDNSSNTSLTSVRWIRKDVNDDGRVNVYSTDGFWWVGCECTTIDPFDPKKRRIEFSNIVEFEGKHYALSVQGALAVVQEIDSRLMITDLSRSRAVPSAKSKYFRECLFEMDGEIILILFVHRESIGCVDEIEVYRLDLVKLDWIKVERIGGKTLFLDDRWSWSNSAEIGCKGDCVYFKQGCGDGWWVYDMENRCISEEN